MLTTRKKFHLEKSGVTSLVKWISDLLELFSDGKRDFFDDKSTKIQLLPGEHGEILGRLELGWFPVDSFRQFFARMYRFATIQNVTDDRQTDRQTDRRQTTHRAKGTTDSTVGQKPILVFLILLACPWKSWCYPHLLFPGLVWWCSACFSLTTRRYWSSDLLAVRVEDNEPNAFIAAV